MRIGIDAHHINGKPQGSRSHLIDLLRALTRVAKEEELHVYSFLPEQTRERLALDTDADERLRHHRLFPTSARLRLPLVVPFVELRDGLSLFHSQYIAPPFASVPDVVTIHDVLFESHPHLFEGAFSSRSVRLIRRSARRARVVFTVSEFSRHEILERYELDEATVLVTPNAIDTDRFRPEAPSDDGEGAGENGERELRVRHLLDGPYVLNVGRIEPRKNLERLFRAFARAKQKIDPKLQLAIVGARDFGHERILAEANALGDSVRYLETVPDEELVALYRHAVALVYPSLVEGFGMPVLEAMACGTPVLCSRGGALPDVAGEAAEYVDAESEEDIETGLVRVSSDSTLRTKLREAGLARVKLFSWDETARKTLAGYHLATGQN
jgi:glycosyltransferase involved in cell wall biosynthesis